MILVVYICTHYCSIFSSLYFVLLLYQTEFYYKAFFSYYFSWLTNKGGAIQFFNTTPQSISLVYKAIINNSNKYVFQQGSGSQTVGHTSIMAQVFADSIVLTNFNLDLQMFNFFISLFPF